jgi:hypothetical protein
LTSDGRLPLDEHLARFEETLRRNRTLTEVLTQAAGLDLPGWYLVAGACARRKPSRSSVTGRASRGKMVARKFRSTFSNCSGGTSSLGSFGRPSISMWFWSAYSRIPWARVLPSVDRLVPRAAASSMNAGTGRGSGTGHVAGSRGVSRVKTWVNVRAAASRAVNGSPRPHCWRSVAIREVCRCSVLNTSPSATHGDTMMAGTR